MNNTKTQTKKPLTRLGLLTPPLYQWVEMFDLRALRKGYQFFPDILVRKWWPVVVPPIMLVSIWMNDAGQGPQGGLSALQWVGSIVMGGFFYFLNYARINSTIVHLRKDGIYIFDLGTINFHPYDTITDYQIVQEKWGKALVIMRSEAPDVAVGIDPETSVEKIEQILSPYIYQS
jgi:hypothetical protein